MTTPPTEELFRQALGQFATGVTVVTTQQDGHDHAMTASAFTSVSLQPMLVLVCVEQDSRFHEAIAQAEYWAVSVLARSARPAATWLATRGRPLLGQLTQVPHHRGPQTGQVLLDQALVGLECRTSAQYPAGDHTLVVGEVLAIELPDLAGEPLLYHRGAYAGIAAG